MSQYTAENSLKGCLKTAKENPIPVGNIYFKSLIPKYQIITMVNGIT